MNDEKTMRESSYVLFEIPSIKKVVLICEDYGEASFVLDMDEDYQRGKVVEATKEELIQCFSARWIKFEESNIERWYKELDKTLFADPERKREKIDIEKYRKNMFKMDKAYFENAKNIKTDLEEYSKKVGSNDPRDLKISKKYLNERAKCSNGEEVFFLTFLIRAKNVFKRENNKENFTNADMLKKLLLIAGYVVEEYSMMDKSYFENIKNVQNDLEEYAKIAGHDNPIKLFIGFNEGVKCNKSEVVKFHTYFK